MIRFAELASQARSSELKESRISRNGNENVEKKVDEMNRKSLTGETVMVLYWEDIIREESWTESGYI